MQMADAAAQQLGAFGGHRHEQRIGRIGEQLHAVFDQLLRHTGQIEAEAVGFGHDVARLVHVLGQRGADLPVVAEGVHRCRRNGVDGVAADQLLDIQHVAIRLVLHAGAGPEQALRIGAGGGELLPAIAGNHRLVFDIRHLRVRDGHAAAQLAQSLGITVVGSHARVDLLVDLRIDAADEEAGDAGQVADIAALGVTVFQPGDVGLGDRLVGFDREQQRHVDVDAFADQRADRRHAFLRAGHLHHQVRPVHPGMQAPRLGHRVLLAQSEVGRDFQADEAVQPLRALEDRLQHFGDGLDVFHRQRLVDLLRVALAAGGQRLELGIVIVSRAHRFLEDRRVGGDAAQTVGFDQMLQAAVGNEAAADEIEPGRLALGQQLPDRVGAAIGWRISDGIHDGLSWQARRGRPACGRRRRSHPA